MQQHRTLTLLFLSFAVVAGLILVAFCAGLLVVIGYAIWGFLLGEDKVLMIDFHTYEIPPELKVSRQAVVDGLRRGKGLKEQSIKYYERVLSQCGIGDATGLPLGLNVTGEGPVRKTLRQTLPETEMVIFNAAEEAMRKAGISPREVDIVISSSSAFAPTPSMAAMLVNRFKLRHNVRTYHFAGMGASSAVICLEHARHMLTAVPNAVALVVTHENVTANWYPGDTQAYMAPNCLYRLGGAAAILSNRPSDASRAKYELLTTVRTHLGRQDEAFECMGTVPAEDAFQGVLVTQDATNVIKRGVRANLAALGPLALTYTDLAMLAVDPAFTPDVGHAFQHILLHTAGAGVLDTLAADLRLTPGQMKPARDTLARFGNTSSASTWYVLAGIEHGRGVRRGDRIWQLCFGSGFKCNSAVWQARRDIQEKHSSWS